VSSVPFTAGDAAVEYDVNATADTATGARARSFTAVVAREGRGVAVVVLQNSGSPPPRDAVAALTRATTDRLVAQASRRSRTTTRR
jgi:hypothetical protein